MRVNHSSKRTIQRYLWDHEIFLSFNDDMGAEAFDVWWEEVGQEVFAQWCLDSGPSQYADAVSTEKE